MPFGWVWIGWVQRTMYCMGLQIPQAEGTIFLGCPPNWKALGGFAAKYAKMAEVMVMPFEWLTQRSIIRWGQGRMNPFSTMGGDNTVMRPFVTFPLWSPVMFLITGVYIARVPITVFQMNVCYGVLNFYVISYSCIVSVKRHIRRLCFFITMNSWLFDLFLSKIAIFLSTQHKCLLCSYYTLQWSNKSYFQ